MISIAITILQYFMWFAIGVLIGYVFLGRRRKG